MKEPRGLTVNRYSLRQDEKICVPLQYLFQMRGVVSEAITMFHVD